MRKIFLYPAFFFVAAFSFGNKVESGEDIEKKNGYHYVVSLKQKKQNTIKVDLICPKISTENINFNFPSVIPGHYEKVDFGRFIKNFSAYDINNNKLKVRKNGVNSFTIINALNLKRITYQVNSTYYGRKGREVPPSSGSIFSKDKVFAFNTSAVFGYFDGIKNTKFYIDFQHPDHFYGVTSLQEVEESSKSQSFISESYNNLIDCPILFAKPDTASFYVGNTLIQVGVYAETGIPSSGIIKNGIIPYLNAVQKYIGDTIPVKKYSLLVYLKDLTSYREGIYGKGSLNLFQKISMSRIKVGALEHGTSSFYFFADAGRPESYLYYMQRTCTHEFLHIYSPLSLKSDRVADFNFQDPKMSKHLWLYEGVTDYLSWQAKLQAGLIGPDEFFSEEVKSKMFMMNKFPTDISFTKWSEKILEKPWRSQYNQVYNKGTITAMFLDFEIMRLTNGSKNLAEVVFKLSDKFRDSSFHEDLIFDEFVKIVHPDLKEFFARYIDGTNEFDLKSMFSIIGFDFQEKVTEEMPLSILDGGYGVEMAIERVRVYNIEKVTPGSIFKEGDKILYEIFGENCTKPFRDTNGNFVKEGTVINLPIIRDGKETNIRVPVKYAPCTYHHKLTPLKTRDDMQNRCLKKWLNFEKFINSN